MIFVKFDFYFNLQIWKSSKFEDFIAFASCIGLRFQLGNILHVYFLMKFLNKDTVANFHLTVVFF